jgi:hypothetical protein
MVNYLKLRKKQFFISKVQQNDQNINFVASSIIELKSLKYG